MNNEPVAWMYEKSNGASKLSFVKEKMLWEDMTETPLFTHPAKTLTDEEINQLWAESHEDGIAIQQGFTTQQHYFARAILRKAQEK
jgi:hypothetical protein